MPPELNLIEHVWYLLERRLWANEHAPASIKQLCYKRKILDNLVLKLTDVVNAATQSGVTISTIKDWNVLAMYLSQGRFCLLCNFSRSYIINKVLLYPFGSLFRRLSSLYFLILEISWYDLGLCFLLCNCVLYVYKFVCKFCMLLHSKNISSLIFAQCSFLDLNVSKYLWLPCLLPFVSERRC